MSPDEFWGYVQGFDYRYELEWLQTREILAYVHNSNPYLKRHQRMKGSEIYALNIDKEIKTTMTHDEIVKRGEAYKRAVKEWQQRSQVS